MSKRSAMGHHAPGSWTPAAVALAALALSAGSDHARAQDAPEPAPAPAPSAVEVSEEARAWGALVYVGDGPIEGFEGASPQFDELKPKLAKAFKSDSLTLLAQHTQIIFKEYESWVVPSKELYLNIDSRGPAENGGTRLGVQVWQGEKVLAKTDAVLKRGEPLFIGGPDWRGGRLVFVIALL